MELVQSEDRIKKLMDGDVLIYKHSTTCPISAAAEDEVEAIEADIPVAKIHVIEDRAVSQKVEDMTGIKHESPQAIMIKGGKPVWNASHREVTVDALQRALKL